MSDQSDKNYHGHHERLRQRFLSQSDTIESAQLLELLLTYAIPRRDVAPIAEALIDAFRDIDGVFNASMEQLTEISGVGENAAALLKLVHQLRIMTMKSNAHELEQENQQIPLFELPNDGEPAQQTKIYANDEIANALYNTKVYFKKILVLS